MEHEPSSPEVPESPGSLIEFAEIRGIDPRSPETFRLHAEALSIYRQELAAGLGVQLEDLHRYGRAAVRLGGDQ